MRSATAVLATILVLALAGCEANPKQVDQGGRVLLEGFTVSQYVSVLRQESDRVEGDLLRVRTELKNRKKENIWVDIQVVWKDAKGFSLYETSWAPFMIPARYTKTHEIVSINPQAADYEYRVRQASKAEVK